MDHFRVYPGVSLTSQNSVNLFTPCLLFKTDGVKFSVSVQGLYAKFKRDFIFFKNFKIVNIHPVDSETELKMSKKTS